MTRDQVYVRAVGKRDTQVSGRAVFTALTELGIPKMRPRVRSGDVWLIPANRTEDFLAYCDHRRIPIVVTL